MLEISNENTQTSNLDVSDFYNDKIFNAIVETMTPYKIRIENNEIIKSFAEAISFFSPISINSLLFYSKKRSTPNNPTNIETVQDTHSRIYLNNFWSAWNYSKYNHSLQHNLSRTLQKYKNLTDFNLGIVLDKNDILTLFGLTRFG